MNRYPLNAADVAGNREVYGDDALHDVALDASGQVIVGRVLAGATQIEFASQGELIRGLRGQSESEIEFEAVGELYRGLLNDGLAEIAFYLDGDGVIAPPASATFTINFNATADATVVSPVYVEPRASQIQTYGDLEGRKTTAKRSSASFPIRFNANGAGNLEARGDGGTASMRVLSEGEARLGRKIYLEAMRAIIKVNGVGESLAWRQRYGEGTAQLRITMQENRYGKATITAEFVAAPSDRSFTVQGDNRLFVVPMERSRA